MSGRRNTWPWVEGYHPLVIRDVMYWCGDEEDPETMLRGWLETATWRYTQWGLLTTPYNNVLANRVVSTHEEYLAFGRVGGCHGGGARPIV